MTVVGVLLAGGASRRMGRDKASICVEGISMAERAQRLLLEVTDRVVVVGHARGVDLLPAVSVLPDAQPGAGPLAALSVVVDAYPGDRLVVVAVDQPRLTPSLLRTIRDHPNDICAYSLAGRIEPLPMALNGGSPHVRAGLRGGMHRLRDLPLTLIPLAAADAWQFVNVNDEGELLRLGR